MVIRDAVRELAAAMREVGSTEAHWSDGPLSLFLTLGPEPSRETAPTASGEEIRCACGHHPLIEHSEAGCLLGCSAALCDSEIGSEPQEE